MLKYTFVQKDLNTLIVNRNLMKNLLNCVLDLSLIAQKLKYINVYSLINNF